MTDGLRELWKRTGRRFFCLLLGMSLLTGTGQIIALQAGAILEPGDFVPVSEQGFGDRQNSIAWAMQWWKGKLYVGTNRAARCTRAFVISSAVPGAYPPSDPDLDCTANPYDLPLQAEIWRLTPETGEWEQVYKSPNEVRIPAAPAKFTANDFGYRYMLPFTEPDGTEALYVSGVSTRFMYPKVPPPRILRTTDGVNFEPLPQLPGTVLGDVTSECFRSMASYKGRLYVVACQIWGSGRLLEAADPRGGNDSFRYVTAPGVQVFSVQEFNGYLYLGLHDEVNGYSVFKTSAEGNPPYSLIPVVTNGGFAQPASTAAVSMALFNGSLYVGTGSQALGAPGELIRINADDSWDLLMGAPRMTHHGWKTPLSGMGPGFNNPNNLLLWRMGVHEGTLYIGTFDQSTDYKQVPGLGDLLRPEMGFDLLATTDGSTFTTITRTGFGDMFAYGARGFQSTPYGLYIGTANDYYGTVIYRAGDDTTPRLYLPVVLSDAGRD
jgi:hypothetical protein